MTERPHIKPPLHGARLWRYKFRRLMRVYRQVGRAAQNAGMSIDDALVAMREIAERTYIETGKLPQEDA